MVTTGSGGAATDAPPLVEARGRRVQFGKVTALDGLDLVARAGQVLAVLGPDGAGKTTFIRTVAALVPPSGGELRVRGFDVSRDPAAVQREIGLAGQAAAVEPTMTGREDLPHPDRDRHRFRAGLHVSTYVPAASMVNAVRSALTGGTHDLAAALIWSAALIVVLAHRHHPLPPRMSKPSRLIEGQES
jgi:ABC-type sugar transport system ATPase subunit